MSRFEFTRPETFPPVVKNLIIINVLVYVAQMLYDREGKMSAMFALFPIESPDFRIYQVVTHMFMHSNSQLSHIIFNMLSLWMFGRVIEVYVGSKRFLTLYIISGLSAAALHLGIQYFVYDYNDLWSQAVRYDPNTQMEQIRHLLGPLSPAVGASGAIMGVLVVFGYLFPNTELMLLFFPVPIKAKYFIPGLVALDLFGGIYRIAGDNIAHWAHLGGALAGFIVVLVWNKTNRNTLY